MANRPLRRFEANERDSVEMGINALIVCHAGAGLGLGHLTRSLVVASALQQELSAAVRFLLQGDPVQRDDLAQFHHHFLSTDANLAETIHQQVQLIETQIVVLDLHPGLVPTDIDVHLKALRQVGCRVIGIDGLIIAYAAQRRIVLRYDIELGYWSLCSNAYLAQGTSIFDDQSPTSIWTGRFDDGGKLRCYSLWRKLF